MTAAGGRGAKPRMLVVTAICIVAIVALAAWELSTSGWGRRDPLPSPIGHSPAPPVGHSPPGGSLAGSSAAVAARPGPLPAVADEVALQDFVLEVRQDRALGGARSPRELHAQLQAEPRDEAWNARIQGDVDAALGMVRENFGEAPRTTFVDCRETLCEIHAVSPGSLAETPGDWLDNVKQMRDSGTAGFVDSHTTAKVLGDGRILYLTFLVR